MLAALLVDDWAEGMVAKLVGMLVEMLVVVWDCGTVERLDFLTADEKAHDLVDKSVAKLVDWTVSSMVAVLADWLVVVKVALLGC